MILCPRPCLYLHSPLFNGMDIRVECRFARANKIMAKHALRMQREAPQLNSNVNGTGPQGLRFGDKEDTSDFNPIPFEF